MSNGMLFYAGEVQRTLNLFTGGEVTENRVLGTVTPDRSQPHTRSGYFEKARLEQVPLEFQNIQSTTRVYFTPNRVNPDMLAWSANRLKSEETGRPIPPPSLKSKTANELEKSCRELFGEIGVAQ